MTMKRLKKLQMFSCLVALVLLGLTTQGRRSVFWRSSDHL